MAYTLNTGHPLYANLIELIGVQGGALVSHKTARTFTKHAEASYGTGTFGEHFTTLDGIYTAKGASFTPRIDVNTTTTNKYTVFIVFNGRTTSGGSAGFLAKDTNAYSLVSPAFNGSNKPVVFQGYTSRFIGSTTVNTGAHSIGITRDGTNSTTGLKLYVDGAFDSSSTVDYDNAEAGINYIGGYSGQGSVGASVVWIAVFDKELTAAELLAIHNSVGASNAFGLVSSGNAAPTFPGPNIGNLSGTVGTALTSNNVASKFSDTDALTFSAVGTWPPGVTVSSAGVISGTPTTAGTYASLKVRATDTAAQTVDSDTFSFTINASAHLVTVANSQQVNTASTAAIQQSGNGTITLPALKDWGTGNLKASETGVTIIINNATTGVLVTLLTGQTANASGVLPTLTGLVSGTAYRVTTILADGSEGTWKYTAS